MAFIATPESIAALGLTRLRPRTLQPHHFWVMVGAAALIHALILLVVEHWPSHEPEFTPRSIQIRLGRGQQMPAVSPAKQTPAAVQPMPLPRAKPQVAPRPQLPPQKKPQATAPRPAPKPAAKPAPKPTVQPKASVLSSMPPASQRQRPAQNPVQNTASASTIPTGAPAPLAPLPQLSAINSGTPSVAGSSKPSVQTPQRAGVPDGSPEAQLIRSRYEQVVSQWLQKHQVYPAAAKMLGQQGQPVLRIRMDRTGDVKYSGVDKSSGYRLIDDAAMSMVKRAAPFPQPPANYPGDEKLIEFLIPVAFRIK